MSGRWHRAKEALSESRWGFPQPKKSRPLEPQRGVPAHGSSYFRRLPRSSRPSGLLPGSSPLTAAGPRRFFTELPWLRLKRCLRLRVASRARTVNRPGRPATPRLQRPRRQVASPRAGRADQGVAAHRGAGRARRGRGLEGGEPGSIHSAIAGKPPRESDGNQLPDHRRARGHARRSGRGFRSRPSAATGRGETAASRSGDEQPHRGVGAVPTECRPGAATGAVAACGAGGATKQPGPTRPDPGVVRHHLPTADRALAKCW